MVSPHLHNCRITAPSQIAANYVEVVVEVPRGSFVKRRPDGSVDIVGPVPCPFNYGSIPSIPAPDGDPLDAIVLGSYLPYGHVGIWRVCGMVKFMDAGEVDNKLVCVQHRFNKGWCPIIHSLTKWKTGTAGNKATLGQEQHMKVGTSDLDCHENDDGESPGSKKMSKTDFSNFREKWTHESTPTSFMRGQRCVQSVAEDSEHDPRLTFSPIQCKGRQPHRDSKRGATVYGESKTDSRSYTKNKRSPTPECIANSEITLGEYLMVTWFFSSYAIFKGALNLARGKSGRTAFEGWEFP